MPRSILVLYAHPRPELSRINRAMADVARALPGVHFRDLYATYPEFEIDVAAEQAALVAADVIVWQHPLQWYSSPPLLKEWIDRVLERGWAYGHGGTALRGKSVLSAVSTGGPEAAYQRAGFHHFTVTDFLRPFERTTTLCGMSYLEPFVFYGAFRSSDEDVRRHAALYGEHLAALRDAQTLGAA